MRVHGWGQILPGIAGALYAATAPAGRVEGAAGLGGTLGGPAYIDAHEFDRRAIATFLTSPEYPRKPASLANLYSVRHPTLDVSIVTARNDLMRHWEHLTEPRFMLVYRTTGVPLAGRYVDARGYDCQVLVDIAEHLEAALDGTTLGEVADQVDQPSLRDVNTRRDDALDKTIACLHARLTSTEITRALHADQWPDPNTLDVMAALAAA